MSYVSKKTQAAVRAATFSVAFAAATNFASAAYTVTNISDLLAAQGYGATYGAVPLGLNRLGQVVGYYNATASSGAQVPYVYTPGIGNGVVALTQVLPYFTTQASAINDAGIAVGAGGTTAANQSGFVYNSLSKSLTYLAPTASNGTNTPVKTFLYSINNLGTAVGYVGYAAQFTDVNTRAYRGMTYNTVTGTAQDVGTPFSGPTIVGNSTSNQNTIRSVNAAGVLAGTGPNTGGTSGSGGIYDTQVFYTATPTGPNTYTYTDRTAGIKTADPSFGGTGGNGLFIDDLGNLAGSYITTSSSNRRGFFYNASTGTAVSIDNGLSKTDIAGITDVNGSPVVFGSFSTGSAFHALIFQNGLRTDISAALAGTPYAAYTLTSATGLNANGDLIAIGSLSGSSVPTSFLIAGFVPEPASLAAVGLGAVTLFRRVRRRA